MERVHLQAVPWRGCKIASIWMKRQRPGGSSPQTAASARLQPSDSPHQLQPRAPGLAACAICARQKPRMKFSLPRLISPAFDRSCCATRDGNQRKDPTKGEAESKHELDLRWAASRLNIWTHISAFHPEIERNWHKIIVYHITHWLLILLVLQNICSATSLIRNKRRTFWKTSSFCAEY